MSDVTHEPGGEGTGVDAEASGATGAPGTAAGAVAATQCPNGHAVNDSAAFCPACGARVGGEGLASAPPQRAPVAPTTTQLPPNGYRQPYPSAPPQPYGMAPAYSAPMQQQSTNGLAVASLVLGIVWLAGLGSLLALIFGAVSKRQIRESGGRQTGGGMATAGIVLGIVGIAGAILWFVLIAVAVNQVESCINNPTQSGCNTGITGTSGSSFNTGSTGSGLGSTGNSSNSVSSGSSGNTGTSNTGSTGVVSGFSFSTLF